MGRVVIDDVLSQFNLKVLFHILFDHFNFAVRSISELVDDQVPVVSTEIVKEDGDSETD